MSSSLRRGALAAAALAFSIASLAACGAGHDAQTLQIKPDNAATTVGEVKIQNGIVVTQPKPGDGGPAVVAATLFNDGRTDQTLESVTVADKPAELKPAKGAKSDKITIPSGGSVVLGGDGNASVVLPDGSSEVTNGDVQEVTFTFSKTGKVVLKAFVYPAESYFSEWGPSAVPSASASASGEPSESASGEAVEPSGSASGEAAGGDAAGAEPSDAASASESAAGH
ncbi:hypothetical protein GCM10010358_17740 [Streptomyces minutiscleroticus]|uniref:Lipoprotein n=1 Tax=Streptomyces minutiscleroticus TaxID=68238 RepID=A0A918KJW7_9ACTN|nr:copper chaperone PCu(A)C [Streptomyces minutiscleroticus]GGX63774.1 hypothetical protein GCM10010358_17740 [Streptomyces minutiscleroticus]